MLLEKIILLAMLIAISADFPLWLHLRYSSISCWGKKISRIMPSISKLLTIPL